MKDMKAITAICALFFLSCCFDFGVLCAAQPCKRMAWFTSIDLSKNTKHRDYSRLLKAAVMSWKTRASSLEAHMIVLGGPNNLTAWLARQGVIIHNWPRLSFEDRMRKKQGGQLAPNLGTWLRLDIPLIYKRDRGLFGVDVEHYLYTDADVYFLRDVTTCDFTIPIPDNRSVAMAEEFRANGTQNAGVMFVNMAKFSADIPALLDNADQFEYGPVVDQGLMLRFYGPQGAQIARLPRHLNYRPYWPFPTNVSQVAILHWHGLKPGRCLQCLMENRLALARKPELLCPGDTACAGFKNALSLWGAFVRDDGLWMHWCRNDWAQVAWLSFVEDGLSNEAAWKHVAEWTL